MKSIFSALVASLIVTMTAIADDTASEKRDAVVDERQQNQEQRIEQGVKSGELNAKEAQRLEKQQDHIDKMEDKAMKDGKMNRKEFHRIERAQHRASNNIYRKKHNKH